MGTSKLSGFVVVDAADGLVCGFRRTRAKIYELRDRYGSRAMQIEAGQYTNEEIEKFERAEVTRGPIGIQLSGEGFPPLNPTQLLTSNLALAPVKTKPPPGPRLGEQTLIRVIREAIRAMQAS
jgi:hypothetical protein